MILSYSPGAGKSYFMLEKGAQQLKLGKKVLVGFLFERHRKSDVDNIGGMKIEYNREKNIYNISEILEEKPDVVLMDELGVSFKDKMGNVRFVYEDVERLIDEGIDVYTTVNLKKFQGINDEFKKLSGIGVRKQIPIKFLEMADKIFFIDRDEKLLIKDFNSNDLFRERYMKSKIMNKNFSEKTLEKYRKLSYKILENYKEKLEVIERN